jgi:transcriptional regulator GlxA family with amidase domain
MAEIVITVSLPPSRGRADDGGVTSRRVLFTIFPGFQILDLTGPHEVFVQARRHTGELTVQTVAAGPGPVASSGGLEIRPDLTIAQVTGGDDDPDGPVDTLFAVGGDGVYAACDDARLVGWFAAASARARRIASVCSGAFLLGEAGLLDGRRAVTHWSRCPDLVRRFPRAEVDPDPIFVRDGAVWTSAGITAGIDLALAMVEEDFGAPVARAVARQLVMFVQRPGGQAQFSAQLAAQRPDREPLREVQGWIADHLADDLCVAALAGRAGMSERHFTRVFREATGSTPAAYVEAVRVEAACRLLESSAQTVHAVARACGFASAETLHRSFKRIVQVTPGEYRERFSGRYSAA